MTDKIMIDNVDVSKCKYLINRFSDNTDYCCKYDNTLLKCKGRDCYCKQLARKTEECEKLKEKLNPKLKNAHCVYFEGQTGLCRAKEFKRCNPVNCNLYTIDELSTILDLQQQLQAEQQKVKELEKDLEIAKINYANEMDYQKMYKQAFEEIREVAENFENSYGSFLEIEQILQKCEVLDENN